MQRKHLIFLPPPFCNVFARWGYDHRFFVKVRVRGWVLNLFCDCSKVLQLFQSTAGLWAFQVDLVVHAVRLDLVYLLQRGRQARNHTIAHWHWAKLSCVSRFGFLILYVNHALFAQPGWGEVMAMNFCSNVCVTCWPSMTPLFFRNCVNRCPMLPAGKASPSFLIKSAVSSTLVNLGRICMK